MLTGVLSELRFHTTDDGVCILVISVMGKKRRHSPWGSAGSKQSIKVMVKVPVRNCRENKVGLEIWLSVKTYALMDRDTWTHINKAGEGKQDHSSSSYSFFSPSSEDDFHQLHTMPT